MLVPRSPQVVQTLSEAEQVCVELQQSVCGLDGRLAELLHWDVEARELYQVLKARERRPQRAQDPRARVGSAAVADDDEDEDEDDDDDDEDEDDGLLLWCSNAIQMSLLS